jgi:hypothetical protein
VYRYVRTSAAFAAASLGDDPLGACELDPSVRPGVVADALFAVPIFCAGAAAGVEPTARPSPLKFLSEGLPKQLPMVMKPARRDCTEVCKVSCAVSICCAVGYSECDSPPPRAQPCRAWVLGGEGLLWQCLGGGSLAPIFNKGQEQVRHPRHRLTKTHLHPISASRPYTV